jgi:hypothetical protein
MKQQPRQIERMAEVKRIVEEYGFCQVEVFESWDGEDLNDLREFLTDDEFQTLLDELENPDLDG